MSAPKVTFITHEATRTGAPRVLLTLMQWLKANTDIRMSTLVMRPGPLLREYAALGPVVEHEGDWRYLLFLQRGIRLARQLTIAQERPFDAFVHRASGRSLWMTNARQLNTLGECDLIYANSVQSGWGVRSIAGRAPVLSHLHELSDALLDPYERTNVATMTSPRVEHIIVPALAVRHLLVTRLGVDATRVSVEYPFIDAAAHRPDGGTRRRVRQELEIPDDAVVVGMSGMFILRKSPDRFIDVAAQVVKRAGHRPVYFMWIGGSAQLEYGRYMITDVERLGIADRFRHVHERADPRPYLAALDIFMLSSRSDPFPLVCLEAASMAEAPIVCFDQAGGMPELVGDECGIVVPYLDVAAAAEAILRLVDDPELRRTLGRNAAQRVRTRHDVATTAPAIAQIITNALDAGGRAGSVPASSSARRAFSGNGRTHHPLGALQRGGEAHETAPLVHSE